MNVRQLTTNAPVLVHKRGSLTDQPLVGTRPPLRRSVDGYPTDGPYNCPVRCMRRLAWQVSRWPWIISRLRYELHNDTTNLAKEERFHLFPMTEWKIGYRKSNFFLLMYRMHYMESQHMHLKTASSIQILWLNWNFYYGINTMCFGMELTGIKTNQPVQLQVSG